MPAARKEAHEEAHEGPAVTLPVAGRVPLPSGQDLAYYGGLGAMTALELIEWPITVAVAAGYALVTNERRRADRQQPNAQ